MKPDQFLLISARLFTLCLVIVFIVSCRQNENSSGDDSTQTNKGEQIVKDYHSFSQPDVAKATHLDLDLEVDFDKKEIKGSATWKFDAAKDAKQIIFDTRKLNISSVTGLPSGEELKFSLGADTTYMGNALTIDLKEGITSVKINYSTSPDAAGLQWLEPVQTSGKKNPFLFSQSQAILARTWVPCQDSPGIRFTYNAKVKVPSHLMPVMSATNPKELSADGNYSFTMAQPVPSYLLAIAVGDLRYKAVGKRTGIYAEPDMLEKSVWEFADMEKMVEAAEALYGPYRWEQFDVIVLPPSFPFGGMENPRITFATPTVVAGDRSLTSLVAHELAHSWSGNLVTNANWDDFWMNEGFTVYFEKRIMESLYGKDYTDMLSVLSYQDLKGEVEEMMKKNPGDTHLKLQLKDRDPDDGMNSIAYDKGCSFLESIEAVVGRERWDAFLRKYFDAHAFTSMTTEKFLDYLAANLLNENPEWASKVRSEEWIYSPGLPADFQPPVSKRLDSVEMALTSWKNGIAPASLPTKEWSTHEWLYFLRGLPEKMPTEKMSALDAAFGFTKSGNSEIAAAWFMHVIHNDYQAGFSAMENFLVRVGRRKFLKPIYTALAETEKGKAWAKEVYIKARPNYHSVSYGTIDKILGV